MRKRLWVVLSVLALALAACGDGEVADTTQPPEEGTTTTVETPTTAEETTTTAEPMEAPESIKIGAVVPLTGPFGGGGAQVERGYIYAVEAINEAGGVYVEEFDAQLPLELEVRDDASDPNQTTSIMDEFAGSDIVA